MTNSPEKFKKSSLLNKEGFHSIAAISADFEMSKYGEKFSCDGTIVISDCSRAITLNFDCYDKKERANALRKMQIIIDTFTQAMEWLDSHEDIGKIRKP